MPCCESSTPRLPAGLLSHLWTNSVTSKRTHWLTPSWTALVVGVVATLGWLFQVAVCSFQALVTACRSVVTGCAALGFSKGGSPGSAKTLRKACPTWPAESARL